jgi:hypothetical protein
MTESQLRLLKEVVGGKRTFRCASAAPDRLEEFEAVAEDLLRLEAMGFLDACEALNETRTGRRYVDRVHVRGGVTEAGREALKNYS